jgi:hypothetical protein
MIFMQTNKDMAQRDQRQPGDKSGMEDAMTGMFKLSNTLVSILVRLDSMNQ